MSETHIRQTMRNGWRRAAGQRRFHYALAAIVACGVMVAGVAFWRTRQHLLGDELFQQGKHKQALLSYERSLAHDKSAGGDSMRDNLAACFSADCRTQAANLIVRFKLGEMEKRLEPFTQSSNYDVRLAAIGTLEKIGHADKVDYLNVFKRDLEAPSCDARRYAVTKLAKLGDQRALAAIRSARAKEKAETPWYKADCIGGGRVADAERQILARR